jgi:hypothetical protein
MKEIYMIHCNVGGSVFVKTYDFFKSQGGFEEEWGSAWQPVVATSIEDAREKGCTMFKTARPYSRQAK